MWVAKDEVRIDAVDALARVRSRVRSRSPHLFGGRRAPATVFPTRLEEGVVVPDSDGIVGAVATALVTPFRGHRRRFFGRFARRERKRPALCVCCVGRGARLLSSHVSWGSCSGSGAFSFLVGLGALPSFSLSLSRAGGGSGEQRVDFAFVGALRGSVAGTGHASASADLLLHDNSGFSTGERENRPSSSLRYLKTHCLIKTHSLLSAQFVQI